MKILLNFLTEKKKLLWTNKKFFTSFLFHFMIASTTDWPIATTKLQKSSSTQMIIIRLTVQQLFFAYF